MRGRPARKLRLACQSAQVLGLVIDAGVTRTVSAGLDGKINPAHTREFTTPETYEELIETAAKAIRELAVRDGVSSLGVGISLPGLMDYKEQRGLLSPNLPITNGRSPSHDLSELTGVECVMVQESHGLCLAERQFGLAKGLNDFAMLDVGAGVGLGVISGGRLLAGHSGLAGEVGHITVDADGRQCGCGNTGCLETVASDAGFVYSLSKRIGRTLTMPEALDLVRSRHPEALEELERTQKYLGIAFATVINLFNPSTLFVHGRLLLANETLLPRAVEEAGRRALAPTYCDCQIVLARGSKRQGAVAAIIEHLTNAMAPGIVAHDGALTARTVVRTSS
jgi:predicted NBD/HSP70 family sugar kinase